MKKTITAHCLVKNEARFIWYSVMSVYHHMDKILLWDTGSTDGTIEIIREIQKQDKEKKIRFREVGEVSAQTFTRVRQEMLDETSGDWLIVVDGDETWWEASIALVVAEIQKRGDVLESIVVPTVNLVGDIFHYQEGEAGGYVLAGRKGHFALRGINRRVAGLKSERPHGTWGWVDGDGKMIQDRDPKKIIFLDAPYIHATHLQRSATLVKEKDVPKRVKKLKYEIGIPFPADFYYPEVFFRPKPQIVPFPWQKMNKAFWLRSSLETPFRKIKRRTLQGKIGY